MKVKARHQVQRIKDRARYDRDSAYAILDAAFLAHVGFSVDGQPFVIPMLYARQGDNLLLHGSIASRLMQEVGMGEGTIYPLMRRMQDDGLVSTYLVEAPGGPPRKYYRLTEAGRKTLKAQREEWKNFMAAVEKMLGDA